MDSITQAALGAAVGGMVAGRQAAGRGMLVGALAGTLPDLDVLIPYGSDVANFTYHRGFSHSLFYLTLASPLLAWLCLRFMPDQTPRWRRWWLGIWLVLVTHALLDSLTIYGTQIFLPFTDYPVGLGSIFIIDPLYTLPLLLGIAAMLWRPRAGYRALGATLVFSSAYLLFGIGAQAYLQHQVTTQLSKRGIEGPTLLLPTPFNSVLWRLVVMDHEHYYEGFVTWLDGGHDMHLTRYRHRPELISTLSDDWATQRLRWFSKGFYAITEQDGEVVITDLRMGQEPYYVFSFAVASIGGEGISAAPNRQLPSPRPPVGELGDYFSTIWPAPDHPVLTFPALRRYPSTSAATTDSLQQKVSN